MIGLLRPWWRDRSAREQLLIGVAALLLGAVALWLGVLRPVAAARAAATLRHDTAVAALGEVRAMTAAIRTAEARAAAATDRPLLETIGERARTAGLTTERLEADADGRVLARIAAVRPAPLLRWVADLEAGGIVVDRLAVTPNSDATVAAELTLRGSSR